MVTSRKTTSMSDLGERLASLEATVTALEKYEHERWHKLAQDLQPLVLLPERLTREMGKLQGTFDGRVSTISKEIERSITSAVEKAIEPIHEDMSTIRQRVSNLEDAQSQWRGAKLLAVWMVQTLIATVAALVAVFSFKAGGVE